MLDEVDWLIARKKSRTSSDKSAAGTTPFDAAAKLGLMVSVKRGGGDEVMKTCVAFLTCRRGHPDRRPAGPNRESRDAAARDPFDCFK